MDLLLLASKNHIFFEREFFFSSMEISVDTQR